MIPESIVLMKYRPKAARHLLNSGLNSWLLWFELLVALVVDKNMYWSQLGIRGNINNKYRMHTNVSLFKQLKTVHCTCLSAAYVIYSTNATVACILSSVKNTFDY